ncbi:MAG TPA: hypothetical protein VFZ54_08150 [Burkholderiales bacterium]
MLMKVLDELCGGDMVARDGRFGVLENVYFERESWDTCYLQVAAGTNRVLVSPADVAAVPARRQVMVSMSRQQLGARAWPAAVAAHWLRHSRVCSARHMIGWPIVGDDGAAGEVADLLLDAATWSIDYVLANVVDAFGARQVVVPLAWADALEPQQAVVRMRRTRAQLASAPQMGAPVGASDRN